ncbi:MAG: hypothetical protein AAGF89_02195 [Bacteroidota bacterium]
MRLILLGSTFIGLLALLACQNTPPPGTYVIELTDSIVNPVRGNFQVYWGIADTVAWEATLAAADTIYEDGNYRKLRSKEIWYEMRREKEEWRATQPYPGWERRVDSIDRQLNVIRMLDNNRVLADIPAADVVVGRDSFRIAVIHIKGKAFPWQEFDADHPDYLLLSTKGNGNIPIVMDQDNIGAISRKTVFRVGRRHFVLKNVSDDRREIIIEETEVGREFPLVAELDLYYKQVPVMSLDSTLTTIKRTPGKDLAIYFAHLGQWRSDLLLRIDSLYRELPTKEKEDLDIAVVVRDNFLYHVKDFTEEHQLTLPVYVATEKTCLRMNCHPYTPYFVGVNEMGRITTFYGWHSWLEERLGVELAEEVESK